MRASTIPIGRATQGDGATAATGPGGVSRVASSTPLRSEDDGSVLGRGRRAVEPACAPTRPRAGRRRGRGRRLPARSAASRRPRAGCRGQSGSGGRGAAVAGAGRGGESGGGRRRFRPAHAGGAHGTGGG